MRICPHTSLPYNGLFSFKICDQSAGWVREHFLPFSKLTVSPVVENKFPGARALKQFWRPSSETE